MFALSEPGKLDDLLAAAGLTVQDDAEIECPVSFDDADTAARAFVGAGPMALAIGHSGEQTIAQAVRGALALFTGSDGRITLAAWYRAALAVVAEPR
jgi:hypothetical protein